MIWPHCAPLLNLKISAGITTLLLSLFRFFFLFLPFFFPPHLCRIGCAATHYRQRKSNAFREYSHIVLRSHVPLCAAKTLPFDFISVVGVWTSLPAPLFFMSLSWRPKSTPPPPPSLSHPRHLSCDDSRRGDISLGVYRVWQINGVCVCVISTWAAGRASPRVSPPLALLIVSLQLTSQSRVAISTVRLRCLILFRVEPQQLLPRAQ